MNRLSSKSGRLKQVEGLLLNAPRNGYSTTELAKRLAVERTTAWRYITELEEMGVPVVRSDDDRYRIDREQYISNVRLTRGESLMLYLAMRHQARRLTHVPPAMIRAMEKLATALEHPLSIQLATLAQQMSPEGQPAVPSGQVWEVLLRGWYERITVHFWYRKFKSDEAEERWLQPYLFEPAVLSEGIYVIGYSPQHQSLRTYKVERIAHASLTTEQFPKPDDIDVGTLLRHAWGVWYGAELHTVRLSFPDPAVARRVQETRWHPSQEIEEQPGGGIIWSVQVAGLIELVPWIRGWGPDVEVLEPPDLRQRIADEMRQAAALYKEV